MDIEARLRHLSVGLVLGLVLALPAPGEASPPQEFQIRLPDGRTVPVARFRAASEAPVAPSVILWHGGGWTRGEPALLFPHARFLASSGYHCLVPRYPLAGNGRGIADCVADARDILEALVSRAGDLGIDREKIHLLGESAGGHLAAMLASNPQAPPLAGLILWNPVVDLRSLPWLGDRHGPPPDRDAFSPVTRLTAAHAPTLLLHGTNDTVVPVAQAEAWRAAALRAGTAHRVEFLPDTGHAFAILRRDETHSPGFEEALARTLAFLRAPKTTVSNPGEFEIVHAFDRTTGWQPFAELSRQGETAWGSTHAGGDFENGVLFRIDLPSRTLAVAHAMSEGEGAQPFTGLSFGEGVLWGVNKFGGPRRGGTLFQFIPERGLMKILAPFGAADGPMAWNPHAGPIAVDGYLWGTTFHGGETRWGGSLYRVPTGGGGLEIMQSFSATTGEHPTGQLLAHDGWLYGTLSDYGKEDSSRHGALFRLRPDGSGFEVIHRFAGGGLGAHPYDRLVPHPDGVLLGTTFGRFGDPADRGTLFAWRVATGQLETLIDFNLVPDAGGKPNGAVLAGRDGEELLLTTHGSLDTAHGFPGTALRVRLGVERSGHGPARRPSVKRIEVLHTFTGNNLGSTPTRTPLRHADALWGAAAFGHDGPGRVADQAQTGGLIYRLGLPAASPPDEASGEASGGRPILGLPLLIWSLIVVSASLILVVVLRSRR